MPIIDSISKESKFDVLIRIDKADALMSFIMATHNCDKSKNKKDELIKRLKSAYELYRTDRNKTDSGAGTYGKDPSKIEDQFFSHYTMGYEMGIWKDSNFTLSELAKEVAKYKITVREYIGIVFLNLFAYYNVNNEEVYHHFFYEILCEMKRSGENILSKDIISRTIPLKENNAKKTGQVNIIFNYLKGSSFFSEYSKDAIKLEKKWINNIDALIKLCNLEYKDADHDTIKKNAQKKDWYSAYVTKKIAKEEITNKKLNSASMKPRETGRNILLYGIPGCGKSYTIKTKYCNDFNYMERIVFHPDYMNAEFIGQILPTVKEEANKTIITYDFFPGPFTRILKKAINDPYNMYYLVIEEINRGNAAAIFGEVFQLLDRDENGVSSYCVNNELIAREVFGDKNKAIYIPNNLTIVSTMNTADQNVFTLDTAFQRRWDMEMIINKMDSVEFADEKILDTSVTWRRFNEVINRAILLKNENALSFEDKRIGAFFVNKEILKYKETKEIDKSKVDSFTIEAAENMDKYALIHEEENNRFGEKIIKYLWDDAFKFSRSDVFLERYKSLEEVTEGFNRASGDNRFDIFVEEIKEKLVNVKVDIDV